jgi:phosphatidylglycerophosphatase A
MNEISRIPLSDKVILAAASLFGIGYFPLCPGTASCIPALIIFLLVKNQVLFLIIALVSIFISFPVSTRAEKILREKDSRKIVIDDFSGMLLTFIFIPHDIRFIITGFFLFRMLDMLKIPPADIIERYEGGRGIVGDDLIAGAYANFILQAARILLASFS